MAAVKLTRDRKAKLKTLAKLMNKQNVMPVPIVDGVLKLMDLCVEPREADFLIALGTEPHTFEQAAAKTGMGPAKAREYLDGLVKKGLIWPHDFEDGRIGYVLLPIVVGWLELQLCHGKETEQEKEFARRTDDLFRSMKKFNVFPLRNATNLLARTFAKPYQSIGVIKNRDKGKIEVNQAVDAGPSTVRPTHDVLELIDRHGKDNAIALVHCFCRQMRSFMDEPCRFDIRPETCMVIGPMANQLVQYEYGRKIPKKEALSVLEEVAKAGALHTLFHDKDDTRLPHVAVCNCCWDCCGLYGGYNRGLFPLYFKSYYEARTTDLASCKGCGKCVKHCPTNAIFLEGKKAYIRREICIGCGQCALQCPTNSVGIFPSQRDVFLPMPKRSEARLTIR